MLRIASLLLALAFLTTAQAKIWRVNNTPGVNADFNTISNAVSSASVVNGDTIHIEPSVTDYSFITLNKSLIFIGVGYFLDPANGSTPGNGGLQVSTIGARLQGLNCTTGSQGSQFIGLTFVGSVQYTANGNVNLTFRNCLFASGSSLTGGAGNYSGLTLRKCYFQGSVLSQSSGSMADLVCENNIFAGNSINMPVLTGNNNIVRNNSFYTSGGTMAFSNCYVANNIFDYGNVSTFTNCTVKNNLFQLTAGSQPVPPTATGNQFGVNMSTVYVGTGTTDGRMLLRASSAAIGAGVSVGSVTTPDCGAFGGPDPYRLSGIPNVPSIYSLTAPISIPAGTNSMNVTISTRNNN
jgi:hypothetical protein